MKEPDEDWSRAVSDHDRGATIRVKVVPRSSRERIAGMLGERIKVHVSAPPEAGKANAALCRLLAEALSVPATAVTVMSGASSPLKVLSVEGLSAQDVLERLVQSS
jgi:uncharacterized protein